MPPRSERSRRPTPPIIDRELLTRRLFPIAEKLIALRYFTFQVEGIEHVPREGPVVLAQNHAGWFPLDAFFVTYAIAKAHGIARAPFYATHESALSAPVLGSFLNRFGAVPAGWFRRPEKLPPEIQAVGIFPEGVRGNTKPFWNAYRMKDWNRGFVRVAIARDAPIVPTAVLGAEECLPVAWTVKFLEPLIGSQLGLPVTFLPLPSRWRVIFHAPVRLGVGPEALTDSDYCSRVARDVQGVVQTTLDRHASAYPLGRLSGVVAAGKRIRSARKAAQDDPLAPPPDEGERG